MTYIYRVLKNGPIGLWPMDSNFNDVSGFGKNGTVTGAPTVTRPIVAGGISAYQFDGTDKVTFPITSLMQQGYESKAFSLAIWFKADVTAGLAALLARGNSGIFATGTDIEFRLDKGGLVTAKYSGVEAGNRYFVVAVYDGEAGYIYVNGVVVATVYVNAGAFADTVATLRTEASGGSVFTVESAAVYNFALASNTVKAHYDMGNDWNGVAEVSAANGANVYRIWDGSTNLKEKLFIDTPEDWRQGGFTGGAAVIDDRLTQQWDETNSRYAAGEWFYSHKFEAESVTISGARVSWDANVPNLSVAVSLNGGTSFTPVTNGSSAFGLQSLNSGFEPIFRISMPAGATKAIISNFTVAFYIDKDVFGTNEDLPLTVSDDPNISIAEYDYEPNSFNNNAGMGFNSNTASAMIPRDAEFGDFRAVEMTVFLPTLPTSKTVLVLGTSTITTNGTGQWVASGLTALYINGVAANMGSPITMEANKPYHIIAVFPVQPAALYIGNNSAKTAGYAMRLGYLATYYNVISAADVASIYGAWVGAPATRITDAQKVTIRETTTPFRGYAYVWSITGAGQ